MALTLKPTTAYGDPSPHTELFCHQTHAARSLAEHIVILMRHFWRGTSESLFTLRMWHDLRQ